MAKVKWTYKDCAEEVLEILNNGDDLYSAVEAYCALGPIDGKRVDPDKLLEACQKLKK